MSTPYADPVTSPNPTPDVESAVSRLAGIPEVREAVDEARDACTALRWHQALRRRTPEAAAESRVRAARASALLDGADVPVDQVRDMVRGADESGRDQDPVLRTVRSAVQATAESEHVRSFVVRSPLQALARLHVAAGSPLLDAEQVGRPRREGERAAELVELGEAIPSDQVGVRLTGVAAMMALSVRAPTVVVAALVHGEIATRRPFMAGNAVVARAVERAILREGGVDPTGVAVAEFGHHAKGSGEYITALSAYASGELDGIVFWLRHCAGALTDGAAEGVRVADSVLTGRLGPG